MKINDSLFLGIAAGIIGSIPSFLFNFILVQLGIAKYYVFQIASGIHLLKKFTTTPIGAILGILQWLITGAILGIILVYIFRLTGEDYWWVKSSIIIVGLMYIGIYGFFFNFGAQITPNDVTTNVVLFIDNLLFALTTAYLIVRWWGEKLESGTL